MILADTCAAPLLLNQAHVPAPADQAAGHDDHQPLALQRPHRPSEAGDLRLRGPMRDERPGGRGAEHPRNEPVGRQARARRVPKRVQDRPLDPAQAPAHRSMCAVSGSPEPVQNARHLETGSLGVKRWSRLGRLIGVAAGPGADVALPARGRPGGWRCGRPGRRVSGRRRCGRAGRCGARPGCGRRSTGRRPGRG